MNKKIKNKDVKNVSINQHKEVIADVMDVETGENKTYRVNVARR